MVDMLTTDHATKLEILDRLGAELLKDAREYIEIDWYDDPTTVGRTFRGRLRVLRRRD